MTKKKAEANERPMQTTLKMSLQNLYGPGDWIPGFCSSLSITVIVANGG
jgi:hypothetical protein